jgi:hypothetical protein
MNPSSAERCRKCGLYTDHLTGPGNPRRCPYDLLRDALGPVVPTPDEDKHLHWLAGMDRTTVNAIASLFSRLLVHVSR